MANKLIITATIVATTVALLTGCAASPASQPKPGDTKNPTATSAPAVQVPVVPTYNDGKLSVVMAADKVKNLTGDVAAIGADRAKLAYSWAASMAVMGTTYSNFGRRDRDLTKADFEPLYSLGDEAGSTKMAVEAEAFLSQKDQVSTQVTQDYTWFGPWMVLPREQKWGKVGLSVNSFGAARVTEAGQDQGRSLLRVQFEVGFEVPYQDADTNGEWFTFAPVRHFDFTLQETGGAGSPFLLHDWAETTTNWKEAVANPNYKE